MTRRSTGTLVRRRLEVGTPIASAATSAIVVTLLGRAVEILIREGPQRHLPDPEINAPVDELESFLRSSPIALPRVRESFGRRRSSVAVHDDRDVDGPGSGQHRRAQSCRVDGVRRSEDGIDGPPVRSTEATAGKPDERVGQLGLLTADSGKKLAARTV